MKNGLEEQYIIKDNKKLRFGYTTGSCAAAAAQGATRMLFSQETVTKIQLMTPKGILLYLDPKQPSFTEDEAICGIEKYSGDDPDVTNGMLLLAKVSLCSREEALRLRAYFGEADENEPQAVVGITAGVGIGTVTLPGLEQPVGAYAINKTPRHMITEEVQAICEQYQYHEGVRVELSIPEGAEIAKKTFNPKLGITGGISVIGTSGIVEPMSEQALITSIQVEMKQKTAMGRKYLLITPGNYGVTYLNGNFPFGPDMAVKCSNFVGQTIDYAVNLGLDGILFVAHIGKFIKLAGGVMNTHSREADCRMELLASSAIRAGADANLAREILDAVTTDEGLRILSESSYWDATLRIITDQVEAHLAHRCQDGLQIGAVIFSNVFGELGRTSQANDLINHLLEQEK